MKGSNDNRTKLKPKPPRKKKSSKRVSWHVYNDLADLNRVVERKRFSRIEKELGHCDESVSDHKWSEFNYCCEANSASSVEEKWEYQVLMDRATEALRAERKKKRVLLKRYHQQLQQDFQRQMPVLDATVQEEQYLLHLIARHKFGWMSFVLGFFTHFRHLSSVADYVCGGDDATGRRTTQVLNRIAVQYRQARPGESLFDRNDTVNNFLIKLHRLARKIGAHQQGYRKNLRLLLDVCASEVKVEELAAESHLVERISAQEFNRVDSAGDWAGYSPVLLLCSRSQGICFLASRRHLIEMVQPVFLNTLLKDGWSGFFGLCREEAGRQLLLRCPHWVKVMESQVLNCLVTCQAYCGESVVYWLCSTLTGLEILRRHPRLIRQLSKEALHYQIPAGEEKSRSAGMALMENRAGRALIRAYLGDFLDKLSSNSVYTVMNDSHASPLMNWAYCDVPSAVTFFGVSAGNVKSEECNAHVVPGKL